MTGGATRQASVRAGLEALAADPPELVLIHDAARPFASDELIARAVAAAAEHGAAVPALALTDTVKIVDSRGFSASGPDRAQLRTVQTPQSFRYDLILEAHRAAAGIDHLTDDAAVAEAAGHKVATFSGEVSNVKLTTAEDFVRAEREAAFALADIRTATGFDVHAFGDGDHVMLGGIAIRMALAFQGIPMPTWCFTRSPTRCSAPLAPPISATISRPPTRNGRAPPPTASSPMPQRWYGPPAGGSPISTPP